MAWCIKCGYGNKDYNFNHCGHCGNIELTEDDPFAEARKTPRTLRDTRKDVKNKKKDKDENASITKEVEEITKGNLKSRDYETFA